MKILVVENDKEPYEMEINKDTVSYTHLTLPTNSRV